MSKPLVVITGASSGIGLATAQLFSSAGYPLLLLARRLDRLEALNLPNCICRSVDVRHREEVVQTIQAAEQQFGAVDTLINNAGTMLMGKMAQQDPEEWDTMFDINVKGLLNGVHAVLPGMIGRKHGTIINVSSIAGRKNFPNRTAYVGTKFAVHSITENLREEVSQQNIRVITIAPGTTETELFQQTTNEKIKSKYEEWRANAGKFLDPQDVAEAIYYAFQLPQSVCIREIVIAATHQQT